MVDPNARMAGAEFEDNRELVRRQRDGLHSLLNLFLERFGEKKYSGVAVVARRPNLLFIVYTSPKIWEFSDRQRVSE